MLSNFMFSFPCCDVRYEFRVKRCSVRLYYYLLCRRFMFYLCFLYLFTYTGVQHEFPVRRCWCHLTVTRMVTIVEQELLTLPEHLSSPRVFCGVRVARSLFFCVVLCRSLFVLLSFFDLRILITPLVSSKSSNLRSVGCLHFSTCFLTYIPVSYDKYIYI